MDKVVKLVGESVDEVVLVSKSNKYKTGKKAEEGKTYATFRYNGVMFTVDSEDPFIANQDAGTISSIKLLEGTRKVQVEDSEGNKEEIDRVTYQFDSFISFEKEANRLKHTVKMDAIRGFSVKATAGELTEAQITALLEATA